MILWCFAAPLATALSNNLGWYDGLAGLAANYLSWGVFFWAGRRYLGTSDALRTLTLGIAVGSLVYFPLILFEIRMSPQLSNIVYGFFPHSWVQHIRYGGYRPIVFMEHALMVSLWAAVGSTAAYWLWRTRTANEVSGVPIFVVVLCLCAATVLCKSGNGWFSLVVGVGACEYYRRARSTRLFRLALLLMPLYMVFRLTNVVSAQQVESLAGRFFDSERVRSLGARLLQEELFNARALVRPLFGWGGYIRGWPVDPTTGQLMLQAVDSLWVILLSKYGVLGLASVFAALGIGPWRVFSAEARVRRRPQRAAQTVRVEPVLLSVIVALFVVDSLVNGMVNPIYVLISGALVSYSSGNEQSETGGTTHDGAEEDTPNECVEVRG
jgi:hypothetical protein